MIQLSGVRVRTRLAAFHSFKPNSYNNALAIIHQLEDVFEGCPPDEKNLIFRQGASLIKALANYESHDSVIMNLRETLIKDNWSIWYMPTREYRELTARIRKLRCNQISQNFDATIEPDLSQKFKLNAIEKATLQKRDMYFSNCISDTCNE